MPAGRGDAALRREVPAGRGGVATLRREVPAGLDGATLRREVLLG